MTPMKWEYQYLVALDQTLQQVANAEAMMREDESWDQESAQYYRDRRISSIESILTLMGSQGWELITATLAPAEFDSYWKLIFKRPIEPPVEMILDEEPPLATLDE